jgi:cytochrome c oxidase assembly factor CtaG
MAEDNSNERFDVAKLVVLSGWSLTILVCILVIGAAVYMVLTRASIDAPIKEWASTCLGFLFGAFVSLVKDFISDKN